MVSVINTSRFLVIGAADVAVSLGRLGNAVEFVAGPDGPGGALVRHLETSRVKVAAPPLSVPEHGTIHVGAADAPALLDRLPADAVVSYAPGGPLPGAAAVEALVARADVVKISAADLGRLYPGDPVEAVAQRWFEGGPALVVVTLGAAGSMAVAAGASVTRPAVKVDVGDTVGAGDAFVAGLLHQLCARGLLTPAGLRGLTVDDLADVLGCASEVAAVNCSRVGADPPWRIELAAPVLSGSRAQPAVCGPTGSTGQPWAG